MELGMGNSLWHLVVQSDGVSKSVLLLLFAMSIICWAVFFCKAGLFRVKKKQLQHIKKNVKNSTTIEQLIALAQENGGTFGSYFLTKNLTFLNTILKSSTYTILNQIETDMFLYHIDQSVDTLLEQEKNYLSILSTSAGVAPLLGLFGTVWGLVHAFMRISEKQVADITTVAPGIAEALMTTLAGLVVAIPALVMFNYLQLQAKSIGHQLMYIGDHMAVIVQQLSVRNTNAQNETNTSRSTYDNGHITHSSD